MEQVFKEAVAALKEVVLAGQNPAEAVADVAADYELTEIQIRNRFQLETKVVVEDFVSQQENLDAVVAVAEVRAKADRLVAARKIAAEIYATRYSGQQSLVGREFVLKIDGVDVDYVFVAMLKNPKWSVRAVRVSDGQSQKLTRYYENTIQEQIL